MGAKRQETSPRLPPRCEAGAAALRPEPALEPSAALPLFSSWNTDRCTLLRATVCQDFKQLLSLSCGTFKRPNHLRRQLTCVLS